jgi:hypothetical protein
MERTNYKHMLTVDAGRYALYRIWTILMFARPKFIPLCVLVAFPVLGIAQEKTPTNIHMRILESQKEMSIETVESIFAKRYREVSGDDSKISTEEYMEMEEMRSFLGKVLEHPSMKSSPPDAIEHAKQFLRESLAKSFEMFDKDRDGFLSETEFVGLSIRPIKRVDTNNDSVISVNEVQIDMDRRKALSKKFETEAAETMEKIEAGSHNN